MCRMLYYCEYTHESPCCVWIKSVLSGHTFIAYSLCGGINQRTGISHCRPIWAPAYPDSFHFGKHAHSQNTNEMGVAIMCKSLASTSNRFTSDQSLNLQLIVVYSQDQSQQSPVLQSCISLQSAVRTVTFRKKTAPVKRTVQILFILCKTCTEIVGLSRACLWVSQICMGFNLLNSNGLD